MFHPNRQLQLLEQDHDLPGMLDQAFVKAVPWDSVVEFATHPSFCGQVLYPRQQTLLRLIFLETEHMTDYDREVIEEWRGAFERRRDVYGVQPDIWERVAYLKARGYRRFPHIQMVLGRRASKGFIGAILAAEQIAYLISLDNPQRHYGIREGKDCFLSVGATSQTQAQRHQYADIRDVVEHCAYLQPFIAETKDHCCVPGTPVLTADLRWVPVETLSVGDQIMGFEEYPTPSKRRWIPTRVVATEKISSPTYRVITDSGEVVECTDDHRWLGFPLSRRGEVALDTSRDEFFYPDIPYKGTWANRARDPWIRRPCHNSSCDEIMQLYPHQADQKFCSRQCRDVAQSRRCEPGKRAGQLQWMYTRDLGVGDRILYLGTWDSDGDVDTGWMGGLLDGEGTLSPGFQLSFSQNPGLVLDKALGILDRHKFTYNITKSKRTGWGARVVEVVLNGGHTEVLRALGVFRPIRLLSKFGDLLNGKRIGGGFTTVTEVSALGSQDVIALGTDTRTLMAAGMFSHNSMRLRTPADLRRIGSLQSQHVPVEHTIATLWVVALSASSTAGRGATGFGNFFDEFAFHVQGTESVKSSEAQPLSTPVLTPHGWRPMGELGVGDFVVGRDGSATKIVQTQIPDTKRAFRVTFSDGSSTRCSPGHLWEVRNGRQRREDRAGRVVTTEEMAELIETQDVFIPMLSSPVVFDTNDDDLPVPSYLLGYLLGDGCLRVDNTPRVALPPGDSDEKRLVEQSLLQKFPEMRLVHHSGYDWGIVVEDYGFSEGCQTDGCERPRWARNYCSTHYRQVHRDQGGFGSKKKMWSNPLGVALRDELGLMGLRAQEKFIPQRYLLSSPRYRLALLQGLMDSDGSVSDSGAVVFCTTSPRLRDGVAALVESLGGQARRTQQAPSERGTCESYKLSFRLPKPLCPVLLPRKLERYLAPKSWRVSPLRRVVSVKPDGEEDMQCIKVAADDGLYVTEHCIVTHNSIYEDWQPSLGQFKKDALTYVPSSPFNMTGKFYELYQQGRILMDSYQDRAGVGEEAKFELDALRAKADLDKTELTAEPGMFILQSPSWGLYEDWERGPELVGVKFTSAPEDDLTSEEQMRRKLRNPEKFRVEREGQFSEVMGQYLDPLKVDAMFDPVPWRDPSVLQPASFGKFGIPYRIHVDPSRTGANFALAIAHTEDAPPDELGNVWPHVIIDRLHVWRPRDFPVNPETGKHEIDYIQIERELDQILYTFPSCTKFSADQWNSVGFLQRLRKKYSPDIRVVEETATEKSNWERAEKFKSALNLGWIHSLRDTFFDNNESLLGMECKFLSEKNGRIVKQEVGPVTTKDLFDAASIVCVDLLRDALERWDSGHMTARSYGSTHVQGLKSGREFGRVDNRYADGTSGQGAAWDALRDMQSQRRRDRGYSPGPLRTMEPRRSRRV